MVKVKGTRKIKNKQKNILIKYDKNQDGIISLDEYLSEELSKGPNAKPTRINYHYQDYENIFNYFMIVFTKQKKYRIMCIPNFILQYGDYVNRTALAYNIESDKLYYGNKMKNSLIRCAQKENTRFIYFTFIIIPNNKSKMTHANIVLIDLLKRTYERFEPYGKNMYDGRFTKKIDNIFETKVRNLLEMNTFTYISPTNISPLVGIQSVGDSYCGMCITISMMYLHMRVLNPDIPQNKLVKFILKRKKPELKKMILKYAKHVENTLKENKYYVLSLFDDLNTEVSSFFI